VINRKIQPLFVAEFDKKEFYIPYHDKFIIKIDFNKQEIKTHLPEELIPF